MEAPLAPTLLLAHLAQYGREWRESKIPPAVRTKGVYRCDITVRDDTFALRFEPQGRGPQFLWRGRVLPTADGSGSLVAASAEMTRGSVAAYAVGLLVVLLFWAGPQLYYGAVAFPVLGIAFLIAFVALASSWRTAEQAVFFEQVLAHVVRSPAHGAPPTT